MQVQGAQSYVARQHAGHNLALEERGRGFDGVREADASLLCAELVDGLLPPVARASEQGRTQQTEGLEERGELGAGASTEIESQALCCIWHTVRLVSLVPTAVHPDIVARSTGAFSSSEGRTQQVARGVRGATRSLGREPADAFSVTHRDLPQDFRGRNPNLPETYLASCEVRYPAAAGVGEEAQSRQSHWFPWSKTMNMETCGHVADLIVIAHAFAELRETAWWHPSTKTVSNVGTISLMKPFTPVHCYTPSWSRILVGWW